MYPELFRIGDFPINTYGVLLVVGLLLALFVASRLAARDGLPTNRIYDLGLWTILGGLLGAKILMLLTEDNVQIFSLDFLRSGGVFYGGLLGGFFALVLLIRFYRLPFLKVADAFAPGVALGQFFGRLGCFAAGDDWESRRICRGACILQNWQTLPSAFRFTRWTARICTFTRRSFTNHLRCSPFSVCWFIYTRANDLTGRF